MITELNKTNQPSFVTKMEANLIVGMYVRVPVGSGNSDFRNFRLGQIVNLNHAANQAQVRLYKPSPKGPGSPIFEDLELPLERLERCHILEETPFLTLHDKRTGQILGPAADGWVRGQHLYYYVRMHGKANKSQVIRLSEADIVVESHHQSPSPLAQLLRREFHHPPLRFGRDQVVEAYIPLRTTTYGLEDLAGSRIQLLPHQAGVVSRVLSDPRCRYLLADEVGLGKTIEACIILKSLLRHQPSLRVLIVVPNSLVQQWASELNTKFWLNFEIIDSLSKARTSFKTHPHFIVSTEDLAEENGIWSVLGTQPWELVIADEVHQLGKNPLLYERIHKLSSLAERLLLLSATPIQRRAEEYLKLLTLLDPARYHRDDLEGFRQKLAVQDKARAVLSRLRNLLKTSNEAWDSEEAEDELRGVQKDFQSDPHWLRLVETALTQLHSARTGKAGIMNVLTYLNENYRLENRVIRNRRARLAELVALPIRQLDERYSYIPLETESIALEYLHSYANHLLATCGSDLFCIEFVRLLLYAAYSTPHALLYVLEQRLAAFRTPILRPKSRLEGRLLPAHPRLEQDRIAYIAKVAPDAPDENYYLERLYEQVKRWRTNTEDVLEKIAAKPELLTSPSFSNQRLVRVLRLLHASAFKGNKSLVFSGWLQTIEVLLRYLPRLYSGEVAEFSCQVDPAALQQKANLFFSTVHKRRAGKVKRKSLSGKL